MGLHPGILTLTLYKNKRRGQYAPGVQNHVARKAQKLVASLLTTLFLELRGVVLSWRNNILVATASEERCNGHQCHEATHCNQKGFLHCVSPKNKTGLHVVNNAQTGHESNLLVVEAVGCTRCATWWVVSSNPCWDIATSDSGWDVHSITGVWVRVDDR
jgi:hypothetical protein